MAKRRKRTSKEIPAKGRLREMADQLWSIAVREDWNWRCAVCGHGKCDAHHLVPRGHESTRYELRNGIALCSQHHQWDKDLAPHQNAAGWLLWLEEHFEELHAWYVERVKMSPLRKFNGTTNAPYFCDVIQKLRPYVPEDEFIRVVGQRFARWLDEQQEGNDSDG